ncbi:hypothetical protein TNIN_246021 [Trichonephila inaurata madagascariensis]|uniref:Uncharacterized protein n=1 Tax=Trichonephila inaurata madagascariensis TaxID=2747483 RepID=A0A8X7CG08_9ARAC|nr:hypothetical protein TNIN_246021 [Trichonephila inaurata madagascariensis]
MNKKRGRKLPLTSARELRGGNVHTLAASFCVQFYMSSEITQLMRLQLGVTAAPTGISMDTTTSHSDSRSFPQPHKQDNL